jgi:hypothetical protein
MRISPSSALGLPTIQSTAMASRLLPVSRRTHVQRFSSLEQVVRGLVSLPETSVISMIGAVRG